METAVGSYGNELLTFVNATVPSENGALSVRQSIQFFFTYQFYRYNNTSPSIRLYGLDVRPICAERLYCNSTTLLYKL